MTEDLQLWAEVDLAKISRNVERLRALLSPNTRLLAVVKANAYGHGAVEVSPTILQAGADWLAVARVEQAAALRDAGIEAPILLLAEPARGDLDKVLQLELVPTLYSVESAEALAELAQTRGVRPSVHIKVDTGMHRYGVLPEDFLKFFELVDGLEGLEVTGVWTHLSRADEPEKPYTEKQLEKYADVFEALGPRADTLMKHAASSAGMMGFPDAHFDMVRAGISIYGIHPSKPYVGRVDLEPALELKARVGQVRRLGAGEAISYGGLYVTKSETSIATVPCGYADGFRRGLGNLADVLIKGKRYRVSGTITMDHFTVDVGEDAVAPGDEVVIIGRQGDETITATELATLLDTIPYEIVCGIGAGVPRRYLNG